MNHVDAFSSDYFQARERFVRLAHELQLAADALPLQRMDTSEASSDLAIDVAVHDPGNASATLLLTSGLHGVEGFFGSAVQLAAMKQWQHTSLPSNVRVVLVHALNPWGFANLRRVDEGNRDLNRNFLSAGEVYEGSPDLYARLDPLLNPLDVKTVDAFLPRALVLIARYGFTPLKRAIAGGQYDFPEGLSFGGGKASVQVGMLREALRDWLGDASRVVHLDFHTGLGKWAKWCFLPDDYFDEHHQRQVTRLFGGESFAPSSTHRGGYATRGGMGKWCRDIAGMDYLYACAEFGTYAPIKMLQTLREENRCHRLALGGKLRRDDRRYLNAKRQLLEVFCPADVRWRNRVVEEGVTMVDRFVEDLSN